MDFMCPGTSKTMEDGSQERSGKGINVLWLVIKWIGCNGCNGGNGGRHVDSGQVIGRLVDLIQLVTRRSPTSNIQYTAVHPYFEAPESGCEDDVSFKRTQMGR